MVCGLHQAPEKRGIRFPSGRVAEVGEHAFDRGAGGDLAEILPAQSIRHDKQPTVRLSLSRRGGLHIAKVVFVVPTGPSDIGKLGELHFQQGLALQST